MKKFFTTIFCAIVVFALGYRNEMTKKVFLKNKEIHSLIENGDLESIESIICRNEKRIFLSLNKYK